jgi:hypothetical protein
VQDRTHTAGYLAMTEWLEQQERQLRALTEENRELRRQLSELRRGVGIVLVIEGRTMPLVALAEGPAVSSGMSSEGVAGGSDEPPASQWDSRSIYSSAPTQLNPARARASFGPIHSMRPESGAATPGSSHPLAAVPGHAAPPFAQQSAVQGSHPARPGPQRQTYPPLAASPDQLPPPARLMPTFSEADSGMGAEGPSPFAGSCGSAYEATGSWAAHGPARGFDAAHPLWNRPEPFEPARNPFADSFML